MFAMATLTYPGPSEPISKAWDAMLRSWMRGQFNLTCANGTVGVFSTLAPTRPPAVQHLAFQKLASPVVRMGAPTGAPSGVSCTQ
jgi:hypothetical protein